MRRTLVPSLILALIVLGTGSAFPAAPEALSVVRATVRFARDGRASLRLDGDLAVAGNLPSTDPRGAGLRIALGPVVLLDGIPPGAVVRVRRNGDWKVGLRPAFAGQGRLDLTLNPFSGTFTLRASGWDGSALLAAGPSGVSCSAAAGESAGGDDLDFDARGRRWEYRPAAAPGPGPGPGGGGGPPPSTFTTIAQGSSSGVTTYRFEVVTDDAAWQALWVAHAGSGPAPAVDFSADMVVGLWLGPRPTGGYQAIISGFVPGTVLGVPCFDTVCPPQGMIVTAIEAQPGGSCATPSVVTHPHHIVRLPRADWGGVLVEIATRVDDCF